MKPVVTVPPAQAEALFDAHGYSDDYHNAQGDLRDDCLTELCRCDRSAGQPWRDDDGEELHVIPRPFNCRVPLPAPSFGPVR